MCNVCVSNESTTVRPTTQFHHKTTNNSSLIGLWGTSWTLLVSNFKFNFGPCSHLSFFILQTKNNPFSRHHPVLWVMPPFCTVFWTISYWCALDIRLWVELTPLNSFRSYEMRIINYWNDRIKFRGLSDPKSRFHNEYSEGMLCFFVVMLLTPRTVISQTTAVYTNPYEAYNLEKFSGYENPQQNYGMNTRKSAFDRKSI